MYKYDLQNTAVFFQDYLDDDRNSICFHWYSLALDIIEFKLFKQTTSKVKRKTPTSICKIFFLIKV